jgi:hypothetical protein
MPPAWKRVAASITGSPAWCTSDLKAYGNLGIEKGLGFRNKHIVKHIGFRVEGNLGIENLMTGPTRLGFRV